MNCETLYLLLEVWFKEANFEKRGFWREDKVAALIKSNLINQSHWKEKPRGNPQKGKAASDKVKAAEKMKW